jgi:hypothetical protein
MKSTLLSIPKMMNMGFHYTQQYSRRNRITVLGLVDHSTKEWSDWYLNEHEPDSLQKMKNAGYDLIEIHFLYGYGLKGEAEEVELTKKMVAHAHEIGIKVLGYFQFYSVQEELFFIENPWAKECVQLNADATRQEYAYDRPALCFSHDRVKQYYLDGIELGLSYCDLDGIRLDNDYYKGCYCPKCQELFHKYLAEAFSPEKAKEIFGFSDLNNISMPPAPNKSPAWLELVKFRQRHRQNMMKLISDKITNIKPDAILGGNPAVTRKFHNDCDDNFYPADLGATHHLVCAENSLSPAYLGDSIRSQIAIYKFGESSGFKVYPSHHAYTKEERPRWPETTEECARTLCEALCYGGHIPCTTWGIRMDENEKTSLYERPYFRKATKAVSDFIHQNSDLYANITSAAKVGVYINRESRIINFEQTFASLHGTIQILMKNRIPFRFVAQDGPEALEGLELLIIPNVQLVSNDQLNLFKKFSKTGKLLLSGDSCKYDEFYLRRTRNPAELFTGSPNITFLSGTPEAVDLNKIIFHFNFIKDIPMPENAETVTKAIQALQESVITVEGGNAIGTDIFKNHNNEYFLHILNYDNDNPCNLEINLPPDAKKLELFQPELLGVENFTFQSNTAQLTYLHTYVVIKYVI